MLVNIIQIIRQFLTTFDISLLCVQSVFELNLDLYEMF